MKQSRFSFRLNLLLGLSLLTSACATHDIRHALVEQILVPVPGHSGELCNRAFDPNSDEPALLCQDLKDSTQRIILWKLKFICKVNGKMYAVTRDKASLVRNTIEKKDRIFRPDEITVKQDWIDLESENDYAFLIASGARCFSQERYSFDLL